MSSFCDRCFRREAAIDRIEFRIAALARPMTGCSLFLTGMQRSGTTLLEKLVARHPDTSILSQPFPLLFVEAKRSFMRELGREDERYPLGHLFREDQYNQEDFDHHLSQLRFDHTRLAAVFDRMQTFSGQYTRFDAARLQQVYSRLQATGFAELLERLFEELSPAPEKPVKGSKETICEEFLPYLLDRGWRCVLILRDPRDVVASLYHGRGQEFGGQLKPTLFNVRNWRKSVAYALQLEGRPGFLCLRYEDVVADPAAAMHRITESCGMVPYDYEGLHGWTGNSSHGERSGVSTESIGAYQRVLPINVTRYIEATCLPEMRLLGYPSGIGTGEAMPVIRDFDEPYQIRRDGIAGDVADPANAAVEAGRLERLAERTAADSKAWFLFDRAHDRLREALQP